MGAQVTVAQYDWQFHFASWQWLWVPAVLLLLYIITCNLAGGKITWRMPGFRFVINQQYLHPRYQLIKKLVDTKIAGAMGYFRWMRFVLIWLVIGLCFIAMAQPEWVRKHRQEPSKYRDIVFVVDTSISMIQRDYLLNGKRVDRMTLLKGVLSRFIDQLQGDNVSIVVYADSVYTLVPLTRDHNLARTMLSRVNIGMAGRSAALGNALAQAVHEAVQSKNSNRVLVLLTDATRLTGDINPDVAMELARQAGLHVYTVAIGARTVEASEKNISGLIYDPADTERLKKIAEYTGGKFYWAGDTRSLSKAIGDIELAERSQDKPKIKYIRQPLYQWPLLAAILLFSVLQLLVLRQRAAI
ncbi:MAG TPA: VWA domain-containing protein [Gammaproteobacteria bacterium]|nr:VWA domain-containing protein [Gammaproteobacteria bacterium]